VQKKKKERVKKKYNTKGKTVEKKGGNSLKKQTITDLNDSITSDSHGDNATNTVVSKSKRNKSQQSKKPLDVYSSQEEVKNDKKRTTGNRTNKSRSMKKMKLESSQDTSLAAVVADFEDKHDHEEEEEESYENVSFGVIIFARLIIKYFVTFIFFTLFNIFIFAKDQPF